MADDARFNRFRQDRNALVHCGDWTVLLGGLAPLDATAPQEQSVWPDNLPWLPALVLKDPVVHHAMGAALSDALLATGVCRSLSGFSTPGPHSSFALLCEVLPAPPTWYQDEAPQDWALPLAADAVYLSRRLSQGALDRLRKATSGGVDQVYALAASLQHLLIGQVETPESPLPESPLTLQFFALQCFRGIRRHLARLYAQSNDKQTTTTLPLWLQVQHDKDSVSDGYATTVLEWFICRTLIEGPLPQKLQKQVAALVSRAPEGPMHTRWLASFMDSQKQQHALTQNAGHGSHRGRTPGTRGKLKFSGQRK